MMTAKMVVPRVCVMAVRISMMRMPRGVMAVREPVAHMPCHLAVGGATVGVADAVFAHIDPAVSRSPSRHRRERRRRLGRDLLIS
jgi:hypothetical protein